MINFELAAGGDIDILLLDYDKEKIRVIADIFSKKVYNVKTIETPGDAAAPAAADCGLLILRADMLKDEAISVLSKYKEAAKALPVVFTVTPGSAAYFLDKIKGIGLCRYSDGASNIYELTMIIYKMAANYMEKKNIKEAKGPSDYILIADDDPDICEFTKSYLVKEGYKVSALSDPRQVLEQVEMLKPLIVFLEMIMPDISGLELLKKIKKTSPRTQVIIMTGLKDEGVCREAIELGASDYLVKPFSLEQLKAMIIVNSIKPRQTNVSKNPNNL